MPEGGGARPLRGPAGDRRAVGLDLGERRIGVALCDSAGLLATPHEVVLRSGSVERDHREIARLVAEADATGVVVGLPRSLNGELGPAARKIAAEVEQLRAHLDVPVFTHDERLTTVSAHRALRQAGMSSRRRRDVVDQVAAAVILQSWLDSGGPGCDRPGVGAGQPDPASPPPQRPTGMLGGGPGSPRHRDGDA